MRLDAHKDICFKIVMLDAIKDVFVKRHLNGWKAKVGDGTLTFVKVTNLDKLYITLYAHTLLNGEYPTFFSRDGWHKRKGTLLIKCCMLLMTLKNNFNK
jgi:hypothetical protein